MSESKSIPVTELAAHVDGRVIGDGSVLVERVASLESAAEGEIAFVEEEKFFAAANSSRASCVIVPAGAAVDLPCRIEVAKPKLAFALVAEFLHPRKKREPFTHATAEIGEGADIDLTVFIGAHVFIGERTRVRSGKIGRAS